MVLHLYIFKAFLPWGRKVKCTGAESLHNKISGIFRKEAETLIVLAKVNMLHDPDFNLQPFINMGNYSLYQLLGSLEPTF